ncbi:hypothetical protein Tco_0985054 [Tanacetum coccineum]
MTFRPTLRNSGTGRDQRNRGSQQSRNSTCLGLRKKSRLSLKNDTPPQDKKHFKTLSLDESRLPDFHLFFDQEEYSEEEVAETIAETMEQYMSKTRADYGLGVVRPKIKDKGSFELKGQFLKELRDNTFSGSDHKDANEHIKKVLEIVDLFYIPNITIGQVMLRAFPMSLIGAEVVLFYNGLDVPTRQILDLKEAIPSKTAVDAKIAIQEMAKYSQKWHNVTSRTIRFYQRNNTNPSYQERRQSMEDTLSKFMSESAKRHKENSNLIKEIRALTDAAIRNQGASIKTLEIQIRQISKVLQERGFGSLSSSTKTNPRYHNRTLMYETKQTTIMFPSRLNGYYYEEKKGSYGPQFFEAYSEASYINNYIPRNEKAPGSFTLPCIINNVFFDNALTDLGASDCEISKSAEKLCSRYRKRVFPIYFLILVMPEEIKLPLIIGRPFCLPSSDVIKEFRARNDASMVSKVFGYPSDYDYDKEIQVTYQMARSHPRFKNHANEECNKIPPLLKVSEEDKMNEISHSYQNLNGFYKGVLNLGPEYVRDAKMEEWLTRGHINDLAERKEIENVGGESTIWKSGSVRVLKSQDGYPHDIC